MTEEFDPHWPHGHVTRDGRKATIIMTNSTITRSIHKPMPIIAGIYNGNSCTPHCYHENGRYLHIDSPSPWDLINAPAPIEFSIDWPHGHMLRDGRDAKILTTEARNPGGEIVSLVDTPGTKRDVIFRHNKRGRALGDDYEHDHDLLNKPDPSLPKVTKPDSRPTLDADQTELVKKFVRASEEHSTWHGRHISVCAPGGLLSKQWLDRAKAYNALPDFLKAHPDD